jgi:hypothetical protein
LESFKELEGNRHLRLPKKIKKHGDYNFLLLWHGNFQATLNTWNSSLVTWGNNQNKYPKQYKACVRRQEFKSKGLIKFQSKIPRLALK